MMSKRADRSLMCEVDVLPAAIPNPIADPPKNNTIKCSAWPTKLKALSLEIVGKPLFGELELAVPKIAYPELPTASATIDEKAIAPVASLKAASDSMRVESPLGPSLF